MDDAQIMHLQGNTLKPYTKTLIKILSYTSSGGSGNCMDHRNKTQVTEFTLLGFQNEKEVEFLLFSTFLLMYVTSLLGNTMIILLVCCDYRLHSPMYFFVANLAFLEVAITSTVVPKMLANTFSLTKTISFVGCLTQSFFYFLLGSTEFFILAVMSFDRYVAICNPLRYASIMSRQTCIMLLLGSYVGAFLSILASSILTAALPFCGPNVINHFFCDSAPVLKLVCADISRAELADFISSAVLLLGSLLLTGVSYIYIIITILRIPSAQGRQKAFSTCASHIIVVTLYYGSSIFIYVRPKKGNVMDINKFATVLNTIVTPMLNPFIYSLRNEKVKESLRDAFNKYVGKKVKRADSCLRMDCSLQKQHCEFSEKQRGTLSAGIKVTRKYIRKDWRALREQWTAEHGRAALALPVQHDLTCRTPTTLTDLLSAQTGAPLQLVQSPCTRQQGL
ncbi:olfactory receptor 6M1-like [Eulemur rufifrons]|uniref:olfactory receptor 6M1-like n=1 Tax=Eulemur rufifrons TaxID=859984 RepID=UPI003741F28E